MHQEAKIKSKRPSTKHLVEDIFEDMGALADQYMQLAQIQTSGVVREAKAAAFKFGVGAACILLAGLFLVLTATDILLRYSGLPPWACYGIIGVVLAIVGWLLVSSVRRNDVSIENADLDADLKTIH